MPAPRGRLAPSPTGALHLGNARSFLLAWLAIRSRKGGILVLRIEDLDGPRVKAGADAAAIEDLRWLGLDWDEGEDAGGEFGPYRQSERGDRYRAAIDRLFGLGLAYPCVCTRAEIERAASAPHPDEHDVAYPGTCRGRFASVAAAESASGRPASVRFRVEPGLVAVGDGFASARSFDVARESGDFVIEKVERAGKKAGERTAAYQLACVVDDAAMKIDEVLRGDDLFGSAARQILLYRALGLAAPRFFHVPLLVGEDGRRLAKRHGDTTVRRFRESGVPAAAVVGWLAAVSGLVPFGARAMPRDLVPGFDLARVPRERVVVREADVGGLLSER